MLCAVRFNSCSSVASKLGSTLLSSNKAFFHSSTVVRGFEEFFDDKKATEAVIVGRGWTAADLRKKSFDDLHKLWYVLYKERNVLLTEKEKRRRHVKPSSGQDESRYSSVKRSMAAIKLVLDERKKISEIIAKEELVKQRAEIAVENRKKLESNKNQQ